MLYTFLILIVLILLFVSYRIMTSSKKTPDQSECAENADAECSFVKKIVNFFSLKGRRMHKEMHKNYPNEQEMPEVCEEAIDIGEFLPDTKKQGKKYMLHERICHIMEAQKRYTDPDVNLDDLANELGTNRTYISRVFNKVHNKRFNTYLNDYRFREAHRLIDENPDIRLEELAYKSGFNSLSTLSRVVKQNTGLSVKLWKMGFLENNGEEQS